jgi:hypothetical protein
LLELPKKNTGNLLDDVILDVEIDQETMNAGSRLSHRPTLPEEIANRRPGVTLVEGPGWSVSAF